MPDGSKYMILRFEGVFSRKMNLEKYPFDVQNLELILEDHPGGHQCGSHLGQVFDDGLRPTGLWYCRNGVALTFRRA